MTWNIKDVIDIRYASIRSLDISNGEGVGVALFVQGCPFHCKNCFNKETWDFNGGYEWTPEVEEEFIKLISRPFIKRISLLGGEVLAAESVKDAWRLVNKIRVLFPEKSIWLYSGYTWEQILEDTNKYRLDTVLSVDVFVDGLFVDSLKDLNLKWRGSSNQRVIDVKKSIENNFVPCLKVG